MLLIKYPPVQTPSISPLRACLTIQHHTELLFPHAYITMPFLKHKHKHNKEDPSQDPNTTSPSSNLNPPDLDRKNSTLSEATTIAGADTDTNTTKRKSADDKEIGPDHPVHKIPLEKQEKMRKKGVNPVLKAEMDEAFKKKGWMMSFQESLAFWTI